MLRRLVELATVPKQPKGGIYCVYTQETVC